MSTAETTSSDNSTDYEAPEGWHWGIGSAGTSHYTKWLYTDKMLYEDGEFGWECQIWHDAEPKGDGKHRVQFIQYTRIKPDGDPEYDYPTRARKFDTKEEAIEYALETAAELR